MIILKHELKEMTKGLLIWSISVGLICAGCILLYKNLESQLSKTAQLYANMGDMTKALGMDKISLATLNGYFATEIVLMFGLEALVNPAGSGLFQCFEHGVRSSGYLVD